MAPRLAELRAGADLAVIEREDADALWDLGLGHLDITLVQEYPGDDVRRDGRLADTVGRRDPLRFVLPPSSPSDTTLAEGRDVPWLVDGTGTRSESVTRGFLVAGDLEPTVVGNVSDNHLLLAGRRPPAGGWRLAAAEMRMVGRVPRMQVYLPDELYEAVKGRGLSASELLQEAVRASCGVCTSTRRRGATSTSSSPRSASRPRWSAPEPSALERARAAAIARRIREGSAARTSWPRCVSIERI